MILLLFVSTIWASDVCQNHSQLNDSQLSLKAKINDKLAKASHLVSIAQSADGVLLKLTEDKSPILLSWLETNKLTSAPEETIAQEWRKYYFDQFILGQYPTPKPEINATVEAVFKEISEWSNDSLKKLKRDALFLQAKTDFIKYLESLTFEENLKKKITQKIKDIKLQKFKQLKGSPYQNNPRQFLDLSLELDVLSQTLFIGPHINTLENEATLYALIIYQMTKSIDPCQWSLNSKEDNPFTPLLDCLKNQERLKLKLSDDSTLEKLISLKKLSPDQVTKLKNHPYCYSNFDQGDTFQKAEINLAFSHWLTAEIVAQSSFVSQNFYSSPCREIASSSHTLKTVVPMTYASHPKIKTIWKSKDEIYCSLKH